MPFSLFGKSSEKPAVQLYGKLPIAKDYLRIGCGEGAGRALREWLDRTFGTVRDGEDPLVLREPLRFVYGGDEPLQGMIWASTDSGGHRRFPFTLFVERRQKALASDLRDGLLQAEGVWRALAEQFADGHAFDEGRDLLEGFRGRGVVVDAEHSATKAGADFDTFVDSLWPEAGLGGLHELFDELASLPGGSAGVPVRLPLVRELPIRDQVLAWVNVLRGSGVLDRDEIPTLFFPPRSLAPSFEMASLVACGRPLGDAEASWLTAGYGAERLGPGDFCAGYEGSEPEVDSAPDESSPLSSVLVEALSAHRGNRA